MVLPLTTPLLGVEIDGRRTPSRYTKTGVADGLGRDQTKDLSDVLFGTQKGLEGGRSTGCLRVEFLRVEYRDVRSGVCNWSIFG